MVSSAFDPLRVPTSFGRARTWAEGQMHTFDVVECIADGPGMPAAPALARVCKPPVPSCWLRPRNCMSGYPPDHQADSGLITTWSSRVPLLPGSPRLASGWRTTSRSRHMPEQRSRCMNRPLQQTVHPSERPPPALTWVLQWLTWARSMRLWHTTARHGSRHE